MSKNIKSVFIVVDPESKYWHDTCATSLDMCKTLFVKSWLSRFDIISSHEVNTVWNIAVKNGWNIVEFPVVSE